MNNPNIPILSIVIVSFNTRDLLIQCLNFILKAVTDIDYEIFVVDNASNDCSAEMVLLNYPNVILIRNHVNIGFGAANNQAFKLAKGKYIALINSDAFLKSNALKVALNKMNENPEVAIGGGRLILEDETFSASARLFPSFLNIFLSITGLAAKFPKSKFFGRQNRTWESCLKECKTDWVPGAFSIIRKNYLDKIGYFDERFFLYYEEIDLCHRFKLAGYLVWYWPEIEILHLEGKSSNFLSDKDNYRRGGQIVLWEFYSMFLYFYKYYGNFGAWRIKVFIYNWYRVRKWKNSFFQDTLHKEKVADSQFMINLIQRAWKDTNFGRYSPPKPWPLN